MQANSITKDLRAKGRAAFFILRQSVNELISAGINATEQESAPPYFIAAKDEVLNVVKDFNGGSPSALQNLRAQIISGVRSLYITTLYANIAREWVLHGALLNSAAYSDMELPSPKLIFDTHLQGLLDTIGGDAQVAEAAIQTAMAHIPLRMATLKYKEYVTDSVNATGLPMDENDAEVFKVFFNPMAFIPDEAWLNALKKPLDDIWKKDCTEIEGLSVRKDFDAIEEVKKKLVAVLGDASNFLDAVDSALIVAMLNPELTKEEKALDGKALDDAVENELANVVYPAGDADMPEDGEWKEIHSLFYETALDYFTVLKDAPSTNNPEGFLKAFLPYISAEGFAPNRKRFLRQQLLSKIPYPYTMETYKKYFLDTYAALDDANRRYLAQYVLTQRLSAEEKNGK